MTIRWIGIARIGATPLMLRASLAYPQSARKARERAFAKYGKAADGRTRR